MTSIPAHRGPSATVLFVVVSVLGLVACGGPPRSSIDAPLGPELGINAACVEAVRAYLHTLKLDERSLSPGFTIPFVVYPAYAGGQIASSGVARATGKIGPRGHQIYQVTRPSGACNGVDCPSDYVEIAPE